MALESQSVATDATADPAHNVTAPAKKRSPRLAIVVIVICMIAIVALRFTADSLDFAIVNILTLVLAFIALMAGIVHVLRRRDLPVIVRCSPALLLIVIGGIGSRVLKVQRVNGRLVPQLTFRWTPKPDQLLALPVIKSAPHRVDLTTQTAHDFPGFLGPQRNLHIDDVRLDRDWQNHPPRLLWRRPIGAAWSSFAVVNGFAVTMEQRGPHELVTCYEVTTGKPRWSHAIAARHETVLGGVGPRCTPTLHAGRVYALGATGIVRCLDGATGHLLWSDNVLSHYDITPKEDLKAVAWGRSASPLIVDDMVVVPFGGPQGGPYVSLAAYDAATGQLLWQNGDRQVSYSSPVRSTLCGRRQIVIVNEDSVSGHAVDEGTPLWSFPWPGGSASNASVSQAVVLADDRVLLSKGYGGGAMLLKLTRGEDHRISCSVLWKNSRVLKTKFTNVVVNNDFIYGLSDGILECVDLTTGRSNWKDRRQANFGHGQILMVGDVLLVQAESGEVVMVDPQPDAYHELGRFEALTDQTWNNLCLYGPYLLVRNTSEAACYELALADTAEEGSADQNSTTRTATIQTGIAESGAND